MVERFRSRELRSKRPTFNAQRPTLKLGPRGQREPTVFFGNQLSFSYVYCLHEAATTRFEKAFCVFCYGFLFRGRRAGKELRSIGGRSAFPGAGAQPDGARWGAEA